MLTPAGGGVMKCCGLGGALGHRTQGCVYGHFGAFLLGTGAHMWLLALKQTAEDEDVFVCWYHVQCLFAYIEIDGGASPQWVSCVSIATATRVSWEVSHIPL